MDRHRKFINQIKRDLKRKSRIRCGGESLRRFSRVSLPISFVFILFLQISTFIWNRQNYDLIIIMLSTLARTLEAKLRLAMEKRNIVVLYLMRQKVDEFKKKRVAIRFYFSRLLFSLALVAGVESKWKWLSRFHSWWCLRWLLAGIMNFRYFLLYYVKVFGASNFSHLIFGAMRWARAVCTTRKNRENNFWCVCHKRIFCP